MKQIMTMLAIILLNMNNVDAQCVESPMFTIDKNIPSYFELTERHIARNAKYDNSNVLNELLRLNNNTTIELVDTLTDIKGGFHESYKEYYKGIEVEGTRFTIHYDRSGNAVTANGNFRTIENLDAEPIVSEEDALSNVIQYIGAEKYAWQENIVSYIKQDEDEMIESFYPKGQLVFFINQDNVYLAYKFYVECLVPQRSLCVYADALTGSVLSVRSSACEATASVTTRYSGVRSIETQYYNSNYRLRDYTRGNGSPLKFFPAIMLDDYSLNISPAGNGTYTLSLIRKTEDGVLPETSSAADDCAAPRLFSKPWTLEVTNALTGRKTFSKEVGEPTFLLHTDGWEAGVYVVRALVGDASLTGKITVK